MLGRGEKARKRKENKKKKTKKNKEKIPRLIALQSPLLQEHEKQAGPNLKGQTIKKQGRLRWGS